jgi:ADP-dependent phosphofructokinase/glucokinase
MTTTQLSLAARRLVDYFDNDETREDLPGFPGKLTENRRFLAALVDELRLAVAAEDADVER